MPPATTRTAAVLLVLLLMPVIRPRLLVHAQDEDEEEEANEEERQEYWFEEEETVELESAMLEVNATSDEMTLASNVANYLVEMQHLLEQLELDEERARAKRILEHAASSVHQALELVKNVPQPSLKLVECVNKYAIHAWGDLQEVQRNVDACNDKLAGKLREKDFLNAEDEEYIDDDEEEDEEQLERETQFFLKLALGVLKFSPFQDAESSFAWQVAAELAEAGPLSQPIVEHARMLLRRGRRLSRGAKRCVDVQLGEAYAKADRAAEFIRSCLASAVLKHDEL